MTDRRAQLLGIVQSAATCGWKSRSSCARASGAETSSTASAPWRTGPTSKWRAVPLLDAVEGHGIDFDAVGGLTMGADQFAHGVAIVGHCDWFVVRKEPKGRGTNRLVEGATLRPGTRVLLVDDVVTTGGSIKQAWQAVPKRAHGRRRGDPARPGRRGGSVVRRDRRALLPAAHLRRPRDRAGVGGGRCAASYGPSRRRATRDRRGQRPRR